MSYSIDVGRNTIHINHTFASKKGLMKIKYKIGDKFQEQRYGMIYILSKSKISKYDFY